MSNFYPATALTGGGAGALDAIDGAILSDGDVAFVGLLGHATYGNALLVYMLDADSAVAESVPNVISPDTSAGDKRWVLAMSGINSGLHLVTVLPAQNATGSGVTSTVGNTVIAAISKTGAGVDVASVADIANPSSWTNLVSLSGKYRVYIDEAAGDIPILIGVASTENAGDAIRLQVIRDGTTAWDQTVTKDVGDVTQYVIKRLPTGDVYSLDCEETLVIRAARKGDLEYAGSQIKIGSIYYETLE